MISDFDFFPVPPEQPHTKTNPRHYKSKYVFIIESLENMEKHREGENN